MRTCAKLRFVASDRARRRNVLCTFFILFPDCAPGIFNDLDKVYISKY